MIFSHLNRSPTSDSSSPSSLSSASVSSDSPGLAATLGPRSLGASLSPVLSSSRSLSCRYLAIARPRSQSAFASHSVASRGSSRSSEYLTRSTIHVMTSFSVGRCACGRSKKCSWSASRSGPSALTTVSRASRRRRSPRASSASKAASCDGVRVVRLGRGPRGDVEEEGPVWACWVPVPGPVALMNVSRRLN